MASTVTTSRRGRTRSARPSGQREATRRTTPLERGLIVGVAVLAAVGGALAGAEPTGFAPVDVVLTGGFAAVVTLATARARRWTWLVVSGLAAVGSGTGATTVVAAVAIAVALVGVSIHRRRLVGAVVGALAVQVLLRLPDMGFNGASALYAAMATAPVLVSGYLLLPRRRRRLVHRGLIGAGVFAAVAGLLFLVSVGLAWNGVQSGIQRARDGLAASGEGDQPVAGRLFREASSSLGSADSTLGAWWARPARAVPLLAQQAEALEVATGEAATIAEAAARVAERADLEQIRYTSGKVDVARLAETKAPLDEAVRVMSTASQRLDDVDSPWLISPVSSRLHGLMGDVDGTFDDVELAAQAAGVAPALLGGDGPRDYLILFTQPAESRGLGGFVGSWAHMTAIDGELDISDSGPINELLTSPGAEARVVTGPDEFLARYGRFRPETYLQDVTLSPDMPTVATVMAELYPQTGRPPVDGVIVVDPFGLSALLRITGPISVEGVPGRLNADNVVDFLLKEQYIQFDGTGERREYLDAVGRKTFDELVGGTIPGPRRFGELLGPAALERRIMVHAFDPDEQALFDNLGVGGAMPNLGNGDGFMLVSQNKGNNKIDTFLQRSVDYRASFDPDTGELEATATVTLYNSAPASGLPDAIIGSNDQGLPLGTNALYFSFYTANRLAEARVDGERLGMEFQRELGWAVYSRFIEIPPGGTVQVELDLVGRLEPGEEYRLVVGSQPRVNPDQVVATVEVPRPWFVLDSDQFGSLPGGSSAAVRLESTSTAVLDVLLGRLP